MTNRNPSAPSAAERWIVNGAGIETVEDENGFSTFIASVNIDVQEWHEHAALIAAAPDLLAENAGLKAENVRLREALEGIAKPDTASDEDRCRSCYRLVPECNSGHCGRVTEPDGSVSYEKHCAGRIARAALNRDENGEE